MTERGETGWLPDLIYRDGGFQQDTAMFASADGRITRFSKDREDLERAVRLPGRALLPGLVNVHSHSFQRVIRGRTEHRTTANRDTFWTWREAMYHAAGLLSPEDIYHVARMAFLEMLLAGITTVGEFHYLHHAPDGSAYADRNLLAREVIRAAGETGLRIVLLRTAYARAGWQKTPNPGQARFIAATAGEFIRDTEELRNSLPHTIVGVAPHSVRALPAGYLAPLAAYAQLNQLPLHMHISEQPAEIDDCLAEHGMRPVELLQEHGVLNPQFTGIHAIHITESEAALLGAATATVCACPTSERNLGDGAVPAERLGAAGVAFCFGSDSNVQIDLLEDARLLEYHLRMEKLQRAILAPPGDPEGLAKRLFHGATEAGAAALTAPGGTLAPGRAADFITVDLNDTSIAGAEPASLLSHIVFSLERTAIRDVFVSGQAVIREGRHPLSEEITSAFSAVQRQLWRKA